MHREDKIQLSKKSIFALLLSKKNSQLMNYNGFLWGITLARFKTKYETIARDMRVGLRLPFYKT